ncbi:MAG: T9SS type A sorting domain-containing protein [Ignavibacteriales bacterium]|nr:T9SS type A sorting domain-containing protein [Ignavibacteriales bacterium]
MLKTIFNQKDLKNNSPLAKFLMKIASLTLAMTIFVALSFSQGTPFEMMPQQHSGENLGWERYPIEGFSWPQSVKSGETVTFYVSVRDSSLYRVKIYRVPNVSADTSIIWQTSNLQGHFYPLRNKNLQPITSGDTSHPVDFKVGCLGYWNSAFTVTTTNYRSGWYVARLTRIASEDSAYYVHFVVRASNPGSTSKILLKVEFNTWQAYNYWGGGSMYSWNLDTSLTSLTSTDTIAMDRPLQYDFSQVGGFEFIKMLEDSGYTMEYCNNIDLDKNSVLYPGLGIDLLNKYNMLVLWYHDEYWAHDERVNIQKFKGDGPNGGSGLHGNIARFAANTCYWRIWWVTNDNGVTDYRKYKCNKDFTYGRPRPEDSADYWWSQGLNEQFRLGPEGSFLGSQFSGLVRGEWGDSIYNPNHWIFHNTGLDSGSVVGNRTIWGEIDYAAGYRATDKYGYVVNGELEILAQRYFPDSFATYNHSTQMVYYEDTASNARVFSHGSFGWENALKSDNDATDRQRMITISKNIFDHFAGKKYLGNVYTRFENALKWKTPIELDGNVTILQNKYLRIDTTTITIDSNTHCFIDGKMEINGNVIIDGKDNLSSLNVNPTGQLILKANSTLTINNPTTFVMEAGGDVVFEANAKLILNTAVLENGSTLSVDSLGTLIVKPGGEIGFGSGSKITVYKGKLIAKGDEYNRISFSSTTTTPGYWNGITFNGGGPDTLTYCDIKYATNGLSFTNTSGVSLLQYDTIAHCSQNGLNIQHISTVYVPVSIAHSGIRNNGGIGLNVTTARVYRLEQTSIANNGSDGIYLGSSKMYMWDSRVNNNSGYGIRISGSTAYAWLQQTGSVTNSGRNTLNQNTLGEIFVTNSGGAFLGERVTYVYCDCGVSNNKNGIGGSIFSEGCDPECEVIDITEDHGGYNNVYNSYSFIGRLVRDSSSAIKAQMNYWGSGNCPPSSSGFIGSVDYAYCLSSPVNTPAKFFTSISANDGNDEATKGNGNGNGIATLTEEEKLRAWIKHLRKTIAENPDNAIDAFRFLEDLVGIGGNHQRELEIPWELFIELLESSSSSSTLKPIVKAYRLQAKMDAEKFGDAIGFANQILSKKTNDALWLHCNVQKVIAYTALGDNTNAQATYQAMESRARTLDGTMVDNLHKLVFETPLGKMQTVNNSNTLSKQTGTQTPSEKPKVFALEQNFPNPFNPVTVIRYQLPVNSVVQLKIYDVLGKEVTTLVNGYEEAGYKSVEFDASKLSSGIYFYKMVAGKYVATKKLAVMK